MGLARAHDVEMPIAEQVESIVKGRCSPLEALMALMERPSRPEWDEVVLAASPGLSRRAGSAGAQSRGGDADMAVARTSPRTDARDSHED